MVARKLTKEELILVNNLMYEFKQTILEMLEKESGLLLDLDIIVATFAQCATSMYCALEQGVDVTKEIDNFYEIMQDIYIQRKKRFFVRRSK